MKRSSAFSRRTLPALIALSIWLCSTGALVLAEQQLTPGQLRERAEELEQQAAKLKTEGRDDRAQQAVLEANELRLQARKTGQPRSNPPPGDPRQLEIKKQIENAMVELQKLRDAGKQDEAVKIKRHIQELQEKLAHLDQAVQPGDRPERGREPGAPAELRRRIQHIQVAVENLHAAGLHEPAERLAREAEDMRQRFEAGERRPLPVGAPQAEIERLQGQIQELRQAVRELNRRLDDLNRERR